MRLGAMRSDAKDVGATCEFGHSVKQRFPLTEEY